MDNIKSKYVFYIVIISLVIGIAIGWFFQKSGGKSGEFTLTDGTRKVVIKLDQEQINEEALFKQIFAKEWTKDASISWLKKKEGIFHYLDASLTDSIKIINPDINEHEQISKNFREISRKRLGPWKYQIDTISIGYPNPPPSVGKANACENGDFYRQTVKLISLNGKNEVIVEVTGKYQCPENLSYPDIQISKEDKQKLFNNTPFSKTEKVFALIIND